MRSQQGDRSESEDNDNVTVACSFTDGEGVVEVRLLLILSPAFSYYGRSRFFVGAFVG